MDHDKKMAIVTTGKMAAIAADHFRGLISEQKQSKMKILSMLTKAEKIDHDKILVVAAGFSALEELEEAMKQRIVSAERVSNDLHKGAHQ